MAEKRGPKLSAKSSNWDRIKSKRTKDTVANRDVFEEQQLERSEIGRAKTPTWRIILAITAGVLSAILTWVLYSVVVMAIVGVSGALGSMGGGGELAYYKQDKEVTSNGVVDCYLLLDEQGETADSTCYETAEDVPVPDWYTQALEESEAEGSAVEEGEATGNTLGDNLAAGGLWKILLTLAVGLGVWGTLHQVLMRNLDAQNLMHDTADINQHANDQHIMLPDELVRKYDFFPDVGAHSDVLPSSMISHVMLSNKGLKKIDVSQRATEDMLDDDGDIVYHKGEILRDEDGAAKTKQMPMIDEKFGEDLFEASGLPADKSLRKRFDATQIPYNADGKNREKLGKYKRVADMINDDWDFPEYEVQRPAGAYIVDTAPVNTMVLAITRAGKGQTYIEPMIDMWMRERRPNNMVINDPKGELLTKNFVRATMRGFQVVQFNLINAMKTDIYNPLGMAAEAAREGDSTKTAMYVENIADVFFPLDGGDDPVWPNAANNAFKRAAYGLIDYYLEEERELRARAAVKGRSEAELETELDEMWGKVTLYNCYQLFVQLTAKKMKNPINELNERAKAGEFDDNQDEYDMLMDEAERKAELWDSSPELDMLTLYFNATMRLPVNSMRTLIGNADNALRAMAGAEKMLASVYGIAITAMSFFTDPTISTLTSGTPSQNTDLGGLSFPRRMGVRFSQTYVKKENLVGMQVKWEAFADPAFQEQLDKSFTHSDIVSREGWARYYFDGKFPENEAWLRLRLYDTKTGMQVKTFHFHFEKGYQTSLNGRYFITDPIKGTKIIKNGVLTEVIKQEDGTFAPGHTMYKQMRLTDISSNEPRKVDGTAKAIMQNQVRYSESPKAVFLVTPPHLMKYAKLILILLKQLVDLNFDKSYMTKENQKPLYKTRFMLDELGNLQSEGHGISGFETMLSIGLGQEQQFTLILQTLQQLRDVYGESVDKIVQGNAQPLDAKIATPKGWITMGEAEVGQEVLTPAGGVSSINGVFPKGKRKVYKVTRRDGSTTKVCNEHLWEVVVKKPTATGDTV